jgi:hypothetical protein
VRQCRLADPGDILDEQMAAGEKGHQGQLDDLVLAANDALDGLLEPQQQVGGNGRLVVDVSLFHTLRSRAVPAARLDFGPRICYLELAVGRLTQR